MYGFKNSVLLIVFNYSDCIRNKDTLKKIYGSHFKSIIFYSDYPVIEDDEVNFINIERGFYTQRVFSHAYSKYKELIDDSDGLFYSMDDNIVNMNILNLYRNDKIIYYYREPKLLEEIPDNWQWARSHGKPVLRLLMDDPEFKSYGIDKFTGGYADWFYLPKKYLNSKLFHLFDLFGKHGVFLELAVPSVIHNIELNKTDYQYQSETINGDDISTHTFSHEMLWSDRHKFLIKDYVYKTFNCDHNLVIHPIKFNENPGSKDWLLDIFCKEKCVVITTINKPTESIFRHINNPEYDVIIVGDNKTPDDYKTLKCIYLDVASQKKLFPTLSELLPYNHYCRKNLGYLYAIKRGYKVIYETDDDNIPYDNFDSILNHNNTHILSEQNTKWINIFKYFTNNAYIWPRGFPLSMLKNTPNTVVYPTDKTPSVINGLVENDPDVDALFRIICNHEATITWEKEKSVLIDNKNVCVFNTQNTFWINSEIFMSLLIPSSVSFRYCDILRGIITNVILKNTDNYMMYSSPNVVQKRNEHDLISDFKSEYEMYIHNESILNYIDTDLVSSMNIGDLLSKVYINLLKNKVIEQSDLDILNVWKSYF